MSSMQRVKLAGFGLSASASEGGGWGGGDRGRNADCRVEILLPPWQQFGGLRVTFKVRANTPAHLPPGSLTHLL